MRINEAVYDGLQEDSKPEAVKMESIAAALRAELIGELSAPAPRTLINSGGGR